MGQHRKAAIEGISTEMKLWRTVSLMENKLSVVGKRKDEKDRNEMSTGADTREEEGPTLRRVRGASRLGSSLRSGS